MVHTVARSGGACEQRSTTQRNAPHVHERMETEGWEHRPLSETTNAELSLLLGSRDLESLLQSLAAALSAWCLGEKEGRRFVPPFVMIR